MSNSSIVPFNPNPDKQATVVYHPTPETSIEFPLDIPNRTVWSTQRKMAQALNLDINTVGEHIQNYKRQRGEAGISTYRKFRVVAEDGKMREVEHYNMTVVAYVGFRAQANETVIAFQDWVGQILNDTVVPMSPAEIILMQAQRLVDIERAQAAQADQIRRIEARQDAVDEKAQYFTVVGYALYIDRHIDKGTASTLGKRATALSRQQQIPMGKAKDTSYGSLNTYHESVLKAVFDAWFVQFPLMDES